MNYDTQRVNRVDTDGTVNNIEDESEYIETQAVFTTDPSKEGKILQDSL
jgi:hypothetical protein